MNKVIELGNITNDLEIRKIPNGKSLLEFGIAVSGFNKTTDFFQCKAWETTGENIAKYFKKGDKILIEGRLKTSEYEGKYGKVTKVYIDVTGFDFLKNKSDTQNMSTDSCQSFSDADSSTQNVSIKIDSDSLPFY